MFESWMKWAFLEGLTKTAKRGLFKFSGLEVRILAGSFAINFWVGQIQAAGGLIGAWVRGQSINVGKI